MAASRWIKYHSYLLMCSSNTLPNANVIWLKLQPLTSSICSPNIFFKLFLPYLRHGKHLQYVAWVMFCFSVNMPFKHRKCLISKNPRLHPPGSQWQTCAVVDECTEPNNKDGWRVCFDTFWNRSFYFIKCILKECPRKCRESLEQITKWGMLYNMKERV